MGDAGPPAVSKPHPGKNQKRPGRKDKSERLFEKIAPSFTLNLRMKRPSETDALVQIKLLHTAIWLFFAGCIIFIPFAVLRGDRRDNFDIYLPLWLARHNKMIFGTLFAMSEVFVLTRWLLSRR
jgi:hypothetical protein